MASSVPPETSKRLRMMRTTIQNNICANCIAFGWEQVKPESVQKCGRCKVLQYCSKDCQAEHWDLVHKAHCKKLAMARQSEEVGKEPVGVFSQHPFPDPEPCLESGSTETTEFLVDVIQKVLVRLKSTNPALFLHIDQLPQLEEIMEMNRRQIWVQRKSLPKQAKDFSIEDGCSTEYLLFPKISQIQLNNETSQNIWSTLHLVWGRLIEHLVAVKMSMLKDPRQAMPLDSWKDFIEDDAGLSPVRLKELLQAFSSNQFISFKELLQVFCGGSLVQCCSFCDATMTVEAVYAEVKGCGKGVPAVSLLPHFPPMYGCGAPTCEEEMTSKVKAWSKWSLAVTLTRNKLDKSRCNFCFKLAEEVHR